MRIVVVLPSVLGSPGPVGYWNSEGAVICCMRAQHNTAAIHRTATHGITARTLPRPSRGVRVAWLSVWPGYL
jgi:hypothetical protein